MRATRSRFLPVAIRRVTVEVPDLTKQHEDTVKELFDKRLAYFNRTTTLKNYLQDSPGICNPPVDEAAFDVGRKRILAESLDAFARDPLTRQLVWGKHGTHELAAQYGYLGAVYETTIGRGSSKRRATQEADVALSLFFDLKTANPLLTDYAAWAKVNKLRYVMIYNGVPRRASSTWRP